MALTVSPYPYQRDAITRFLERGNLLLAFDTGLGKTLTAIAIGEHLLWNKDVDKVLLVVPASLKLQWARSLAKFTDMPTHEIKVKGETITTPDSEFCVIVDGTPVQREKQYKMARLDSVDYVIIGYDQVVSDFRRIKQLGCDYVVLDEASAIKAPGTKRTGAVKRHLKVAYRIALTATPIENRPEEVYSIMQWVDESVLGRYDHFDRAYIVRNNWGGVERYKHLDVLHDKLRVAMVRKTRKDDDVAPYMPDVNSEVWRVSMDRPTREAYTAMAADLLAAFSEVGEISGSFDVHEHYGVVKGDQRGDKSALGKLMSIHGAMEMLLAHPRLVDHSADLYETTDTQGNSYAWHRRNAGHGLPSTTPKLDYFVRACEEILDADARAKILVFSFFKGMLPLMAERFEALGYGTTRYDGDMNVREKEASVARFASDPGIRLFLSSHAGAYGTDMPMANWLINYDIPWGAGKAWQINGRHVRASSEFDEVHVRDIVVTGTVEERRLATKGFKNSVASGAVDGKSSRADVLNDVGTLKAHAESLLAE